MRYYVHAEPCANRTIAAFRLRLPHQAQPTVITEHHEDIGPIKACTQAVGFACKAVALILQAAQTPAANAQGVAA